MQALDLTIRHFVYVRFVRDARPPTVRETAAALDLPESEIAMAYRRLHDGHFFFLEPGTTTIRIANPLSAVPTPFIVQVGARRYWANCAWDMLGIPAMLKADATMRVPFSDTGESMPVAVRDGQAVHENGLVHFPLPVRQWYDDIVFT